MGLQTEAIIAAFVPAVIWLAIVYTRDRYEREPKGLIARLFVFSIFAIIVAVVLERALHIRLRSPHKAIIVLSAIAVGLVEEGSKFGVTFVATRRNKNLNEPVDGMIYASTVALGFAAIETTLYILGTYHRVIGLGAPMSVAFHYAFLVVAPHRAFTGALGHMAWAGIVGYAYGRKVVLHDKRLHVTTYFLIAAGGHAAYDALLALGNSTLAVAVLGSSIWAYVHLFRHALAASPFRTHQLRPTPMPPPVHRPPAGETCTIPEGGLESWAQPNTTSALMGMLGSGVAVTVIGRAGDWAHVVSPDGWSGWVDARRLQAPAPVS